MLQWNNKSNKKEKNKPFYFVSNFKTSLTLILLISLELNRSLVSKMSIFWFFGENFLEFVGPNNITIGILVKPNICITPLSIDIAFSNLNPRAVTNTGSSIFEFSSGKRALGISSLIWFISDIFFFQQKKQEFFQL